MFIDTAEIQVSSGNGGSGLLSFFHTKTKPLGGPDGGDGGDGGDVIIVAEKQLHTLMDTRYKRHYQAGHGKHGGDNNKTGGRGSHERIQVPAGTMIIEAETDELLGDLVEDGQEIIVAKGGKAGWGNARFKTATNRAPRKYTPGLDGETKKLRLELKLLADVGLVGLPNAGKSTLLSRISAARPKIAAYPFTTLVPNLGIVKFGTWSSFVVADIPGLIEGAHLGKGLGDEFLRHIERTKILLLLVDISANDIGKEFKTLEQELESFDKSLMKKPRLYALTKADLAAEVPAEFSFPVDVVFSSVTNFNIDRLLNLLVTELKAFDEPRMKTERFWEED